MTDSGLLCPKCNGGTTVYNSRPQKNGTTKRYRECLYCGHRFKTVEDYNFKPIKNFRIKAERKKPKKIKTEDHRKKEMQSLRESGMSYADIGKKFGVSRQRVHQILSKSEV
jgi:transcriptional regulator NrdR family protein